MVSPVRKADRPAGKLLLIWTKLIVAVSRPWQPLQVLIAKRCRGSGSAVAAEMLGASQMSW